ncbi:MAG: SAM-dependent methyltransferase [Bacteroidales bacterium]|nr:SAM-dependent methyltransferase [Bacteroidales bacterium]
MNKGKLYLIPSPLADGQVGDVMPEGTLKIVRRLDFFIVEEIRTARRFLKAAGTQKKVDDLTFLIFNEHSPITDLDAFLEPVFSGNDMGLLSEAGLPCVADPGAAIVQLAHIKEIQVIPLTGPSSIIMALIASGFNGQNFSFDGYLPTDRQKLRNKIKELEKKIIQQNQTQIFIETPYRNLRLFEALLAMCQEDILLCIASDITGKEEKVQVKTIKDWKKTKPDIHKKPAIFLLYH